jgi:spiro-SPASM protein
MAVLALIATDTERTWFGAASRLDRCLAGRPVLQHTIERAARVPQVDRIVCVHPPGQDPLSLVDGDAVNKPVSAFPVEGGIHDRHYEHLKTARKWALTAWRGGLGEALAYDEVLPPKPLCQAIEAWDGDAALVVRGEWCMFDPDLAGRQLQTHLDEPEGMSIAFSQAPPGLSPLVCGANVLRQLDENRGSFGAILGYNPAQPRMDPITRDANISVAASVRDCNRRFIDDTARSRAMLDAIADRLGADLLEADAQTITDTARAVEAAGEIEPFQRLPQQATLELTPRREPTGITLPQRHVRFDRDAMAPELAESIVKQLAEVDDLALTLGGLGDALLHPQWERIVQATGDAGVFGLGIETDLRCDRETIERLLDLPLDLIIVRLNADTAATYEAAMGDDQFKTVIGNLEHLRARRQQRAEAGEGFPGRPWLVPTLVKTEQTVADLEGFFTRWTRAFACQPVLTPATTGCGKMPAMSPVPMTPPHRRPCRQLGQRMTILADGRVALCDQDWLGEAALGDARRDRLFDAWQQARPVYQAHQEARYDELPLCSACGEWHRP